MKLIITLLPIELRRLKIHLILSSLSFLLLVTWLKLDFDSVSTSFSIHTSGQVDNSFQSLLSTSNLISTLGIIVPSLFTLSAIGLLGQLMPFRSQKEWESGQFQMLKMCSWSQYPIQFSRFCIQITLCISLIAITILAMGVSLRSTPEVPQGFITDIILYLCFLVAMTIPLSIAIGLVIDSIRTAYYLRGLTFIITVIQIIGWIAMMNLSHRLVNNVSFSMFPSIPLKSVAQLPNGNLNGLSELYVEPVLISFVISAFFVVLSGRILEEAEA